MAQRYFPEGDANLNEVQALRFTLKKLITFETRVLWKFKHMGTLKENGERVRFQ